MQDSQSLKSEIIAALDRLSIDSLTLLAKFVSFLRADAAREETQTAELASEVDTPAQPAHMVSPRLVNRKQAAIFTKEIVEVAPDDSQSA